MSAAVGFIVGLALGIAIGRKLYKKKLYEKVKGLLEEDFVPLTLREVLAKPQENMGMVIMPLTDHDVAREKVLERNKKLGIDTPLEDLY